MDDPLRPESGVDPSTLLEDWLASTGESGAITPPAPDAVPEVPAGEWHADATAAPAPPISLIDALSLDAPPITEGFIPEAPAAEAGRRSQRLVLFTVASSMYGVPETFVTEVARVPAVTAVPHVPHWVRGVTNLRGDIISVVDLRSFIGLEGTSPHTGRLVVVRLIDEEFSAGLLVDAVEQIAAVALEDVRMPAGPIEGALAPYLTGVSQVGERLVAVLDLERLLRSADVRQFEDRREEASCEART